MDTVIITADMKATDIIKLPGVSDLPSKQKMRFAMALAAEARGDRAGADKALAEALAS